MKRPEKQHYIHLHDYAFALGEYADELEKELAFLGDYDDADVICLDEDDDCECDYNPPALNDPQTRSVMLYFMDRIMSDLNSLSELVYESE